MHMFNFYCNLSESAFTYELQVGIMFSMCLIHASYVLLKSDLQCNFSVLNYGVIIT